MCLENLRNTTTMGTPTEIIKQIYMDVEHLVKYINDLGVVPERELIL